VTLAEEFRDNGFETLAVVNTHNVGAPQYQLGQGFQRFQYVTETAEDRSTMKLRSPNMGAVVLAEARALLAERDPYKPFFLFLHFYDVHTDFTPREEYRRELVQPYEGDLDGSTQQLHRIRTRGETLPPDDLRFLRELYDAEIRTFDEVLGGFLAWLRGEGLLEESLLVVTSDHGEEFQEHGGLLHGLTQYQELLRVPLLVSGPGIPAGSVVESPVHGVDVTPTMLAVMGIETRARHDGVDLSPAWRGGALPERPLFAEADQDSRLAERTVDTKQMVRRGMEKLIVEHRKRFEFYDLGKDPHEREDRIRTDGARARVLAEELAAFLATAVTPESIPPPSAEEQRVLDAMGYGGDERGE
jgi:arylsulfatase A-like enzyme